MKQKVKLSAGSVSLTVISIAVLCAAVCLTFENDSMAVCVIMTVLFSVWLVATLFYAPMSISVDDSGLWINRPLRDKRIPLAEVKSVRLLQPTMGARRLSGSGGFFGYWGWFSERDLGKYFAYYGRSSDCFLVRLRNGRQYMLGCENPDEMVEAINKRI